MGRGRASLVEWFLAQRGLVRGFRKAIYSGLTTEEMARAIEHLEKTLETPVRQTDIEVRAQLSRLYLAADQYDKAIPLLTEIVKEAPAWREGPNLLMEAYSGAGKTQEAIAPGYLSVLDEQPAQIAGLPNSTGRRSALAKWLTAPENPLTARVMVNRLWQSHFGRGLAANASDFGKLGEKPSHPELLDWLAATFVESGWSLKAMHRLMVTSATYRQASSQYLVISNKSAPKSEAPLITNHSSASRVDPENRLLWSFPVRRLEAEQIRDAVLSVTGQLKLEPAGGPSTDQLTPRRSIYSKWLRNAPDPILGPALLITSGRQCNTPQLTLPVW